MQGAIGQHRHAVGHLPERVQIVGDHDHSQPKLRAQVQYQNVNACRAVGVQTRRGLVQKQELGLQHQRPGQGRTLQHAATELRRQLLAHIGVQAHDGQLGRSNGVHLGIAQLAVFAQWQPNVF